MTSPLTKALADIASIKPGALVLDACCGSKMFWFDRDDSRAAFVDKRAESHQLTDCYAEGGKRALVINPDIQGDFTALPFSDKSFYHVVFDPPYLTRVGNGSWLAKKYGKLVGDWEQELRLGFMECFRVLKPHGTLVFKWNEQDVPVSQVLSLTPEQPLYGHRSGKQSKTHWLVFLKSNTHITTELFDLPVSLSPRRAWLDRHGLTLTKLESGRWEVSLDDENYARGEDADEACVAYCLKTGLKHWNCQV